MTYKDPSFQDRLARAAAAKQKALDALRSRPGAPTRRKDAAPKSSPEEDSASSDGGE